MEQINIYSDDRVISRIVVGNSIRIYDTDDIMECLKPYPKVYAVMDLQVVKKCPYILNLGVALQQKNIPMRSIETSERDKTLETVMDICSWLLDHNADRDALVLAVGGGITTDMVGFAASIYKRGVRFAYVPTTLLSQVDAAIGGKTGVNFEKYKNILGVIRQPEFTFLTPQVLSTLPYRDFLSGAAELLKTFIIEDNGNYDEACRFLSMCSDEQKWKVAMENHAGLDLPPLIAAAARVKAGVVSRDQFEKGERRKLNLGHTFAHAIETLAQKTGMDVTHGEAVAMGLVLAARLAERLSEHLVTSQSDHQTIGVSDNPTTGQPEHPSGTSHKFVAQKGLAERIETDLRYCGMRYICPFSVEEMADAMRKDKKAEGSKVHFVLPRAIGDVEIVDLTVGQVVNLMK